MNLINWLNTIAILVSLAGCGSGEPSEVGTVESARLEPIATSPLPGPASIQLTYYTRTETRAPQAGWVTKTYTATGYCVIYLGDTYCWDDGIKTLAWSLNNNFYGPFYYTYWNMNQPPVGTFDLASGGLQNDLMPAPRLITALVITRMGGASAVNTVLAGGTSKQVTCTEAGGILDCVDFAIDLNQTPL